MITILVMIKPRRRCTLQTTHNCHNTSEAAKESARNRCFCSHRKEADRYQVGDGKGRGGRKEVGELHVLGVHGNTQETLLLFLFYLTLFCFFSFVPCMHPPPPLTFTPISSRNASLTLLQLLTPHSFLCHLLHTYAHSLPSLLTTSPLSPVMPHLPSFICPRPTG